MHSKCWFTKPRITYYETVFLVFAKQVKVSEKIKSFEIIYENIMRIKWQMTALYMIWLNSKTCRMYSFNNFFFQA